MSLHSNDNDKDSNAITAIMCTKLGTEQSIGQRVHDRRLHPGGQEGRPRAGTAATAGLGAANVAPLALAGIPGFVGTSAVST